MSAGAAAAAAAMIQATKASGVIVRIEAIGFLGLLAKQEAPLVVCATGGVFRKTHEYLTSYKGLAFFCKSDIPLDLPRHAELINANRIWVPA